MKKMNFTNSLPLGGVKAIRPFGLLVAALAMVFLFGTQNASAQTPQDVGEAATAHTIEVFDSEIKALELELKTPPAGVNTESNEAIVAYYRAVIERWLDGNDFKQTLISISGMVNAATADPSIADVAVTDSFGPSSDLLLPVNSPEYKDFSALVNAVNLEDNSDQDLIDIFNLLRTLKNQ